MDIELSLQNIRPKSSSSASGSITRMNQERNGLGDSLDRANARTQEQLRSLGNLNRSKSTPPSSEVEPTTSIHSATCQCVSCRDSILNLPPERSESLSGDPESEFNPGTTTASNFKRDHDHGSGSRSASAVVMRDSATNPMTPPVTPPGRRSAANSGDELELPKNSATGSFSLGGGTLRQRLC